MSIDGESVPITESFTNFDHSEHDEIWMESGGQVWFL